MDEPGQDFEAADPAAAAPLLEAVWGSDPSLRNLALPALVKLPLSDPTWQRIRRYADDTLMHRVDRPRDDVLAVIEASPWIPSEATRQLAWRVVVEAFPHDVDDEELHAFVLRVSAQLRAGGRFAPSTPEPGFAVCSDEDREWSRTRVSGLTGDQLWSLLAEQFEAGDEARTALVVTRLLESSGRHVDLTSRFRVMRWVEDHPDQFRPDLEGLVGEFERHIRLGAHSREDLLARQVAWVISRGGLTTLLDELRPRLESSVDPAPRLEAFQLVRYSAAFAHEPRIPSDLTGFSYMGGAPDSPPIAPLDVVVDAGRTGDADDDVQFTLYRPSRVRPDVWYSMLAFAHRTEPTVDSTGQVVDPVDEVERRAERILAASPGSFDVLRADSASGLRRGTDLCFQPWIEVGEINPSQQSVRWEEAVHQVEFRVRVPRSADGRRVRGGMTVFAGPILLAEVAFRLPVRSEVTAAPIPNARDTARRYRQIFASYSHRDVAVVDAVEQYATLTGDRYLIDARTLRSGEVWDARLRQLIEEADIFQLFWSRNSMNSAFVKQEWEYALQLRREGFIRPVYWETPLAEDPDRDLPPAPLRRLHFSWLGAPPSSQGGPHPSTQATTPPVVADIAGDAGAVPAAPASPTMTVERPRNRRERSRRPGAGDLVCGECGETNPPARKFCRRCGTSLASAQHVALRRRTLTRVAWAVTAAIVAIVGVAWWLAW